MRKAAFSHPLFFVALSLAGFLLLAYTNPLHPGEWILLRLLLLGFIAAVSVYAWRISSRHNVTLSLLSLVILFLLAEGISMNVALTSGDGGGLASRVWFHRHWKENSLGLREAEPDSASSRNLLFIGDSFTAGQGIADPSDRMTSVLQSVLGDSLRVWNLGVCGSDIALGTERLRNFPVRPDIVVMQWFVNDMDRAAEAVGYRYRHPLATGWKYTLRKICGRSYSLDLVSSFITWQAETGYVAWMDSVFSDPRVMAAHLAEWDSLQSVCEQMQVPLTVVLFPLLPEPGPSADWLKRLSAGLQARGIRVLDMTAAVMKLEARERTVNALDAHPGVRLHAAAANAIAKFLSSPQER